MLLFIPRSLCALKRIAGKTEHSSFGATTGIRIALAPGLFRAEATDGRDGRARSDSRQGPAVARLQGAAGRRLRGHCLAQGLGAGVKAWGSVVVPRHDRAGYCRQRGLLGPGQRPHQHRNVDGRFPEVERAIPKKRPLFSFRIDPRHLADTLLAMCDLLPDYGREVQCFYYGEGHPLGFCAKNSDTGMMIDALVSTFPAPKADQKPGTQPENAQTAPEPEDAKTEDEPQPKTKRRGKKPKADEATPPGDAVPEQATAPVMAQYQEVKQRHPGMVVLFRMGDFYELFEEDAEVAAKVLGLTFTRRDKTPMAGFPHHSLETNLRTLLQAGHRVAICDQVEDDPKARREVTRVVTPGATNAVAEQPVDTHEPTADPTTENAEANGQDAQRQDSKGSSKKPHRRKSAS